MEEGSCIGEGVVWEECEGMGEEYREREEEEDSLHADEGSDV